MSISRTKAGDPWINQAHGFEEGIVLDHVGTLTERKGDGCFVGNNSICDRDCVIATIIIRL